MNELLKSVKLITFSLKVPRGEAAESFYVPKFQNNTSTISRETGITIRGSFNLPGYKDPEF